jgi:hypothetical protein
MPHMDAKGPVRAPNLLARIGMYGCALGIFVCGWLAMKTDDWRGIVGLTALGAVAGMAASAFGKRAG